MTDAHSRGSDPNSSHEAAKRMRGTTWERTTHWILLLNWPRWMSSLDIARLLRKHAWTISPRMKPLEMKGYVERKEDVPRENSNGNIQKMTVWRAIIKGRTPPPDDDLPPDNKPFVSPRDSVPAKILESLKK